MFWAVTSPVPDDATDFGVMFPVITPASFSRALWDGRPETFSFFAVGFVFAARRRLAGFAFWAAARDGAVAATGASSPPRVATNTGTTTAAPTTTKAATAATALRLRTSWRRRSERRRARSPRWWLG